MNADGLGVKLPPHARGDDGLFAGTPAALAGDLHALISDPEIDGVLCATGGYVTIRVLEHVDWDLLRTQAKPIVGYSDATSLLWASLAVGGLSTFHGPMVISEWGESGGAWAYTRDRFFEALRAPATGEITLRAPGYWTDEHQQWDQDDDLPRTMLPGGWRELVPGTARGWLLPGCLPTVAGLIGTPYFPDTTGALLCLEAPQLTAEQLCGLLTQWRLAGHLDRIHGLLIGRQSQVRAGCGPDQFDRVILEVLGQRNIPVMVDVDFGHTEPRLTLPVGAAARMDTTQLTLTLELDDTTAKGA